MRRKKRQTFQINNKCVKLTVFQGNQFNFRWISIDRVADFLEPKGHTIEKRPTTKISKDLYSLLCDEFQIDADKKIASKEVVEAKNKEKEEIREKQERQQEDSIKPQSEIIKASSKVVQFKKLGKIDLEPKKEAEKVETPEEKSSIAKEKETQKIKTQLGVRPAHSRIQIGQTSGQIN